MDAITCILGGCEGKGGASGGVPGGDPNKKQGSTAGQVLYQILDQVLDWLAGKAASHIAPPKMSPPPQHIVEQLENSQQTKHFVQPPSKPPAPPPKQTGSYTNTHASGKTYHGKGDQARSQASGARVAAENNDPHVATDWTPAPNEREAFKQESRRIDSDPGGVNSPNNYNKIESPGKQYRIDDGEIPP
jgi:hypothetical protein